MLNTVPSGQSGAETSQSDSGDMAVKLADIEVICGRKGDNVINIVRLSAGASQELWAFDVARIEGVKPYILRRAPAVARGESYQAGMALEAAVMRRSMAAGVPAPGIVHIFKPGDGLGEGYIMDRIEGETLPSRIMRDERFVRARSLFAEQAGEILARLHQTEVAGLTIAHRDAAMQIESMRQRYATTAFPRPVFEMALRWLEANRPDAVQSALVHGDFRHGNLMLNEDGIAAVLDWELLHLGDPMEDLGWICCNSWRFGKIDMPVGGLGQRSDMFRAYEAVSGVAVDPARVHFWEVMGTLNWGVMCAGMAAWVRGGIDPSPERCAIARRASEVELDLLRMLQPHRGSMTDAG